MTDITYKIASEQEEFVQIHHLNYQTFVEEIPQHEQNATKQLVDKFHQENTYIIAKKQDRVIGMIALRDKRPFSLDSKVEDLNQYLPDFKRACEVRLLSVREAYRSTKLFYELCDAVVTYCKKHTYDILLISGTVRQLTLYKKIGFTPFASLVGTEEALYQPMYLVIDQFKTTSKPIKRLIDRIHKEEPVRLLPGPVQVHPNVKKAFGNPAISHRSSDFMQKLTNLKKSLCSLTNANYTQIMVGTGTLANDVVAAQIKQIPGEGLILKNGEFGSRLIEHANRSQLTFQTIEKDWNKEISIQEIKRLLSVNPSIKWLWTVHCETSTGFTFNIEDLLEVCNHYGVKLCLDACSSVGVVDVDFSEVYLASTVSGKGLGSYPGLAIVFHQNKVQESNSIPRYLDLKVYQDNSSAPFTHSSNLVDACYEAVKVLNPNDTKDLGERVRSRLIERGFNVLGGEQYSPGIITIVVPKGKSSRKLGDQCKLENIFISYESNYLLERNWIQISLMGYHKKEIVMRALDVLYEKYMELEGRTFG